MEADGDSDSERWMEIWGVLCRRLVSLLDMMHQYLSTVDGGDRIHIPANKV